MPTHQFEAALRWEAATAPPAGGTHRVEVVGKPPFEVSAAPQYKGDASRLNPEELFVASLASCQLLTYLALANRAGIAVVTYEDRAVGTLAIADRRMRMTEVVLHPRITIGPDGDASKAHALVETAHAGCFIANSVACAVRVEPEIVRAGAT